jgi:cytochrome P450
MLHERRKPSCFARILSSSVCISPVRNMNSSGRRILGAVPVSASEIPPLPPVAQIEGGGFFPSFPELLRTRQRLGGVFSYEIAGGRTMTFIADPDVWRLVFYAKGSDHSKLESDKLAYHWFGIDKQVSKEFTFPGLDATRDAMLYYKMKAANAQVGRSVLDAFSQWDASGERDLWEVAMMTFVPVVQHLFGEETFPVAMCPHAAQTLWNYDEDFKKVANGMPRSMFPQMEERAKELAHIFETSIAKGNHLSDACPVMKARLGVMHDPDHAKVSIEKKARFMFSVYWASQGNTIPGTFWLLVHVVGNPSIRAKAEKEAREKFVPGGTFDTSELPYITACVRETLRLKVANITHRSMTKDVDVKLSTGETYRIPEGQTVTTASYLQHYNPDIYKNPLEFRPERWLDENTELSETDWFPFGAGTNMCSGRHLAQMELALVLTLFLREFDAALIDAIPEEDWDNTVAMVSPIKRSCRFKYVKRAASSAKL